MKKITTIFIMFILMFSTTFGAEKETIDAGLTPENNLYFLDQLQERISLALTFNNDKKAMKYLKYANERTAEIQLMTDEEKIIELQNKFQEQLQKGNEYSVINRSQEISQIKTRNLETLNNIKNRFQNSEKIQNNNQNKIITNEEILSYEDKLFSEFENNTFEVIINNKFTEYYKVTKNNYVTIDEIDNADYVIEIKDYDKFQEYINKYSLDESLSYTEIKNIIKGDIIKIPYKLQLKLLNLMLS